MADGYGWRHHGGYFHHYHHGGDAGGALIAGLIFGGLAGYLISEDSHQYWDEPVYGYDYPAYYPYGPSRRYVVVEPPPREVMVPVPVQPADSEFAGQNCRMTREYTTTIEIDGKKRDAYGTKCLTADGSWILGRPKLVPKFDN